ncbi:Cell cycle serine/threonine-protein kinase CDC5/MSD2 [Grifola frondosa]|uniref:Cell cycle serine/threonine-protein kinase CDC5/MSD2 n=1 Tax=Grifola frondosa TaxID=5627 RepID=A0A1C7LLB7_GRIFR|nr:Cell cycle serine/threonine-protein kinase CDC5/MSD2 [Grifola frondosa]
MSMPLYTTMPPPPRRHPLGAAVNHYAVNNRVSNHPPHHRPGTPPKPQENPKQPPSPPLPRQNAKVTPPSPPKVIIDKSRSVEFIRVGMLGERKICQYVIGICPEGGRTMTTEVALLGLSRLQRQATWSSGPFVHAVVLSVGVAAIYHYCFAVVFVRSSLIPNLTSFLRLVLTMVSFIIGGFARVYEVQDVRGHRAACKVVTKSSLKTKKAKTKLYAEIKIHKSLDHPNIVRFQDCFEDEENVYMTLELCHNGSLMDMLRRRRRFTEPEARYFMVQMIGACHYMHTHQVIHRDLKLGNLFLDKNMNVKVGDFGLAALIESPGERKKTICGTPNYIAPEVLFDTANGHSFEVDTWSIGVILYTLVVGRPPFQTKDVKAIYKRIRDNEYEFPAERAVSRPVQELVQQILTPDPQQRPTLHEIVDHSWFTAGIVPGYIPTSAHDGPPDFRHITRQTSEANLARLRRYALLEQDQTTSIAVPSAPAQSAGTQKLKGVTSSLAQQEKEFQKAVQPGSPISALLSSARQPLLVAPLPPRGEQPLIRKLQAAKDGKSPTRPGRLGGLTGLQNIIEEHDGNGTGARQEELRKKELESQKARIVAQMVPASVEGSVIGSEDQENIPPRGMDPRERIKEREKEIVHEDADLGIGLPSVASGPGGLRMSGFDAAAQTLTAAFEAKGLGRLFRDPREDVDLPDPKIFIVSWVDYCNKYGMGYALTDGSVGVHFNDSTTIVLSPDKHHFDYISSRRQGSVYVRKNHTVSEYPEDLKSKVYLLKHFERYIMDRLYGEYHYTFEDLDRTKGMDFVQKYLRMKHVIVFKMSHDVLQFNFYDHSKVILSSQGLLITHIDKNYKLTRWTLSEVMALSLRSPVADPEQAKFHQRLVDKLKYCKEVLISIRNVSANQAAGSENDGLAVPAALPTMSTRSSKASLR